MDAQVDLCLCSSHARKSKVLATGPNLSMEWDKNTSSTHLFTEIFINPQACLVIMALSWVSPPTCQLVHVVWACAASITNMWAPLVRFSFYGYCKVAIITLSLRNYGNAESVLYGLVRFKNNKNRTE